MTKLLHPFLNRLLTILAMLAVAGLLPACIPEVAEFTVESAPNCDGHVYAAGNFGTDRVIYGFQADTCLGSLTPLPGSPFLVTGLAQQIGDLAAAPNGEYLFVGESSNPNAVISFTVAADGALTQVSAQSGPPNDSVKLAVDPESRNLYAGNGSSGMRAYAIGAGGFLHADYNAGAPYPLPNPITVTMHPSGDFMVVARASNTISIFNRASDGSLANGPTYNAAQSIPTVAMDPKGSFVVASRTNYMELLSVQQGPPGLALASLPAVGTCGSATTFFDPTGRFAYVNCSTETDLGFVLDRSGGSLVPISNPGIQASGTWRVAWSPNGRFVYRATQNGQLIEGFAVNLNTGVWTPLPDSPFVAATGPDTLRGLIVAQ